MRETELVRKRFSLENRFPGAYVLLTEVHIPQDNTELRADSSFTMFAISRSSSQATENCKLYLDALAGSVHTKKEGKQKGEVSQFAFASRDFYRADFEYRSGVSNRATIRTAQKDYLLLWSIGLKRQWKRRYLPSMRLRRTATGRSQGPCAAERGGLSEAS